MNPLRLLLYAIIGVSLCIPCGTNAQTGSGHEETLAMVTVDAAYGFDLDNHYLTLFVGNKVCTFRDHVEIRKYDKSLFFIPPSFEVQAAYARPGDPYYRRFFGATYGINVPRNKEVKEFKYGQHRKFLRNGGPDAAGKRAGVLYFFKGCKMAIRHKWNKWGKPEDMTSVGLPCDVHAAWAEKDKMVVLKGDQYWNWESDNSVNGPHNFHDDYKLTEWTLAPVTQTVETTR